MTKKSKLLFVLTVLSASVGFPVTTLAQFEKAYSTPNNPPKVELVASTKPIFIDDIVFDGLEAITPLAVEAAFRHNIVGLTKGALLVPSNVEKGRTIIIQTLADAGYLNARVQFLIESVSTKSARITFLINEGPPAVIRDIQVEGNKVFSDDELLSQLEFVSVMSHDVFDRTTLDRDLNNVRDFMRSRGYLLARVLKPKLNALNGNLTIIIPVDEGKLYRIGEITVLDSKRISPEQIVELIGLKKGDIADGRRISEALFEELRDLYCNMGYPEFSAQPDPEYKDNSDNANEGIVDVEITIDEGSFYTIGAIEFQMGDKLAEMALRRLVHFKVGDMYNQQLIRDSLREMNESDWFQPTRRQAGVEFVLNEETHLATIIFTVQENQPSNE